jgi:hypothetical protein
VTATKMPTMGGPVPTATRSPDVRSAVTAYGSIVDTDSSAALRARPDRARVSSSPVTSFYGPVVLSPVVLN